MIGLSGRMEAVCALLTPGGVLADIGTDHGHVPIAMVQRGVAERAIAMDLREGPLSHAREAIARCGLTERIETRLSDGVQALSRGEADSIVIAGMGGEVILHILKEGGAICRSARELILQPQSQIGAVRCYLRENGYHIADEDMIREEGKYYPMLRAICGMTDRPDAAAGGGRTAKCRTGNETDGRAEGIAPETEDLYGPVLLAKKHPVLREYLVREAQRFEGIRRGLERAAQSPEHAARMAWLEESIRRNSEAQERIEWTHTPP